MNLLNLISVLTIFAVLPFAQADSTYAGHGVESIDAKTLEKYVAPPIAAELSQKIQAKLDVRGTGVGILHPDGKRLFFGWNVTGNRQVWRLDGPQRFPVQVTGGEDPTVIYGITPDGKWLVLSRDHNGQENPGLYLQSANGGPLKPIYHVSKVQVSLQYISLDSKWLYFRANDIKPDSYAIYRYELATGKKELLFSQDGTWSLDEVREDGVLLLGKATTSVASEHYEWDVKKQILTPVIGQGEKEIFEVAYSAKPGEFLVLTPKGGDFKRLYRMSGGKLTAISPQKNSELSGFSIDPAKRHIVYQVNEKGYTRLYALDAKTYRPISLPKFDDVALVDHGFDTWSGDAFTVSVNTGYGPRVSYVYDYRTRKLTPWMISSLPETDPSVVVKATLESYPARDGTQIPMFVRRPKQCVKAAKPCPVVAHFHGGPEGQSMGGYWTNPQLLVEQGYIVVEPNVRGSEGYGKKWLDSDNGAKRLDVVTDIEDCAKYIRTQWAKDGVAPKIGIYGGSYGGYSVLIAMTKFAGAYDGGVSVVGMSNLVTFLQNTAPYRRALRISEYGDPEKDLEALQKLSAINYVDRVKAPILIIQGANDPRVPVGEAIQIHDKLLQKQIASQLIVFPDEGHGVQKRQNQVLEMGHMLRFFNEHLKQ